MSAPAPVRFGVSLQNHRPVAENLAHARLAEDLGFDELWTNENGHHRGIFTIAALLAAATTRVGIGLGIVNPFHRHPSVIAMEAATLDEASGGRVRLGIGAALWNLRDLGEADPRTERPRTATVEAIQIIRALLRGEPGIASTVFTVRSDARLDFVPVRPDLPVHAGAVNARMLHDSGRVADAVELGAIVSTGYARWAIERVHEGARAAGRDPDALDVSAPLFVSVQADARAARDAVRPQLAYYLHRVEPVVRDESGADPQDLARVVRAVHEHGLDAGAAAITDELIDVFTASGDPEHVGRRLQEYADLGIRGLILQDPTGQERAASLRLFAREVAPHVA
ncbi:MAG TPA: LLM class flavin-dependent oxidoreductase [Cellulomonas sp.]